ncbi:MAG: type II toxin-antitoxin system VapC family toxin, partial [Candidatus Latescibacteria bacterium]|nr:type II toxin-antitoxin system VapC family toxin [Candidatus Latescibacterota bacterium]
FLRDVFLWDYDRPASEEFGRIRAEQKTKGRPIPPTDAQIAAVARLHDLMVLSDDRHFTYVNDLKVENWLV